MSDPFQEWRDGTALRNNPLYAPLGDVAKPHALVRITKPCGKCRYHSFGICINAQSPSYAAPVSAKQPCANDRWVAA